LFVTLVTEVSLISRVPNLRFENLYIYRDFSENRSVLFPSALVFTSSSAIPGGRRKTKARSAPATPDQHQEVDSEEGGEEEEEEHQQDEQGSGSLQKEVKDLSAKLNQVLGAVAKLTKQVNTPSILRKQPVRNRPRSV
jgi:hypothetical protein